MGNPHDTVLKDLAVRKPRQGWATAFKEMAKNEDDHLLDENELHAQSSWDEEVWTW